MAPAARIGTEFAGYRVEAVLGRGGSSIVYRAEYPRLGIPVALKLLNPEAAEDESFRERFVRESRLAAAVNHPNIITIYDAGVWEDTLYIALRFVAGGDLRGRLTDGPLELERALAIVAQAASGLDAAHARGLVHRDVKPANIMVDAGTSDDTPEIAYVTDFGLLKHVQSGGRPTPSGQFLGTIDYVAPEQIEGRPVDRRADVYSLGCVLFECVAGRAPFERDNDAAILWAHMQEEPPRLSDLRPDVPPAFDGVVACALAKRPDDRYSSCSELVAAARDQVIGPGRGRSTVTAPIPRAPAHGRRVTRRRRLGAASAALLGLATAAAAGVAAGIIIADGDSPSAAPAEAGTTVTRTVTTTVAGGNVSQRLLALIPEPFRDTCRATDPPTGDFDASFVCRPRGGITLVRYSHGFSGRLLGEYFTRRLVSAGIQRPELGRRLPHIPSCSAPQTLALEEWDGRGASHSIVGQTEFGQSDGRVLCVLTPSGGGRFEWVSHDTGVYAYAQGPRYQRVLRWWENAAGPLS